MQQLAIGFKLVARRSHGNNIVVRKLSKRPPKMWPGFMLPPTMGRCPVCAARQASCKPAKFARSPRRSLCVRSWCECGRAQSCHAVRRRSDPSAERAMRDTVGRRRSPLTSTGATGKTPLRHTRPTANSPTDASRTDCAIDERFGYTARMLRTSHALRSFWRRTVWLWLSNSNGPQNAGLPCAAPARACSRHIGV